MLLMSVNVYSGYGSQEIYIWYTYDLDIVYTFCTKILYYAMSSLI